MPCCRSRLQTHILNRFFVVGVYIAARDIGRPDNGYVKNFQLISAYTNTTNVSCLRFLYRSHRWPLKLKVYQYFDDEIRLAYTLFGVTDATYQAQADLDAGIYKVVFEVATYYDTGQNYSDQDIFSIRQHKNTTCADLGECIFIGSCKGSHIFKLTFLR